MNNLKKIIVSVRFMDKKISISASETINSDMVNVFYDEKIYKKDDNCIPFIKSSIKKIEVNNNVKISETYVIIDQTKYFEISQEIISQSLSYRNDIKLTHSTFLEIEKKAKEYQRNIDKKGVPILFSPFKFSIENKEGARDYNQFPNFLKVNKISAFFSVTTIKKESFEKILQIFSEVGVKVRNILTSSNLIPFELDAKKNEDNFTIEIQNSFSCLYFVKNNVVVFSKNLNYSFSSLVKKIAENLEISEKNSKFILNDNFKINLEKNNEETIFINSNKIVKKEKINDAIKSFVKTLLLEANEIIKSKIPQNSNELKINLVGKIEEIENIEQYVKTILKGQLFVNKKMYTYHSLNRENYINILIDKFNKFSSTLITREIKNYPEISKKILNRSQNKYAFA
ncbi:MAG: hypothetical protein ACRCRZ_01800 [Metamycoplasmataceae bacterium]